MRTKKDIEDMIQRLEQSEPVNEDHASEIEAVIKYLKWVLV